jgi:hypothetical protein
MKRTLININRKILGILAMAAMSSGFLISNSYGAEDHRPFSEMKGDCGNFKLNLEREFLAWDLKEQNLSSSKTAEAAPTLALGEKTKLELNNEHQVKLKMAPLKKYPAKALRFAGMAKLLITQNGTYRVSIGSKVWADLLSQKSQNFVSALSFEMQTNCKKIFKTVDFSLEENEHYLLQISSSASPSVDVLITKVK